ncbi:MAG: YncE family protein [Methanobacteriota archaeon]|nr:MAG: YncE family protein [Euryarchaeota archaeon]
MLTPHPSDQGEAALDTVKINFLKRWIDEGAKNDNQQVAYSNSTNLLYVCSQGEAIVNIIDADALVVIRNVDLGKLGFPKSAKPHHIAFDPAGENWFVSCIDNQVNKVLKFSVATNDLVGEETSFIPALLAHHPTENILYISRFMDAQNPTNSIHVIDSQTMTPIDNGNNGDILLPPGLQIPHAMMISHDGNYVYTCSFTEDQFLVVNHAQKDFEDAIILGNDRTPVQGVVSPDDQKVYVSCIGTGEIVAIDVSNSANRFLADSVTVGGQPWHLVTNDDGSKLYGANLALNQVSVINTSDMSFQNVGTGDGTDGLAQPHGIEYYKASDGSERVFITGRNVSGAYQPRYDFGDNDKVGTVVVLDPQTNTIIRVIEIEDFGSGIKLLQK